MFKHLFKWLSIPDYSIKVSISGTEYQIAGLLIIKYESSAIPNNSIVEMAKPRLKGSLG